MPTPLAKGVIVVASVLVAAGIAAYESPEFQQWMKQSSEKVVHAFKSIGNDLQKRSQKKDDPSTREDTDEAAEDRRRQARADLMERSRTLHGRRRKEPSHSAQQSSSFDSLVDADGRLRVDSLPAVSTAIELDQLQSHAPATPHSKTVLGFPETLSSPITETSRSFRAIEPWESQYEEEMRNAWELDVPTRASQGTQSHASESLIDLTPTTEDFPDPDYSIPSLQAFDQYASQTEHLPNTASPQSRTLSLSSQSSGSAHHQLPLTPLDPMPISNSQAERSTTSNLTESLVANLCSQEISLTDDDFSELGDGLRTPASAWTEVDSSVSGDEDRL